MGRDGVPTCTCQLRKSVPLPHASVLMYVCVCVSRVVAEYVYLSQRSTSLNQYGSDVNCQNLVAVSNATTLYPPIDGFT